MYTVLAGDQCNADGNVVSSWHLAVWGKGGAQCVLSSRQAKVLSLTSLASSMLYLPLPWFKLAPCQSLNFRTLIAGIELADSEQSKGILRSKIELTLIFGERVSMYMYNYADLTGRVLGHSAC